MKQVRPPSRNRKLTHSLIVLFLLIMLATIPLANHIINQANETTGRGKRTSKPNIIVDPSSNAGSINPLIWGINAPGSEIWGDDSPIVTQRIRQAKIHLIRIGAIQYSNYHLGGYTCTSPTNCNYSDMDRMLQAIFDAGAESLFIVAGYPGGFTSHDWSSYAVFMQQVIKRYNVDLVLGKRVRYQPRALTKRYSRYAR